VSAIDAFRASPHFGINVLAEDQRDLAERFTQKGQDRFDGLKWRSGKTGVPLLPGVLAAIECAVQQRFTAGDHDIFVPKWLSREWPAVSRSSTSRVPTGAWT